MLDLVEGTFYDFVRHGSKHHLLILRNALFRLSSQEGLEPLDKHVHVGVLNTHVTQEIR